MRVALDTRFRRQDFRVIPVLLPGADPKEHATLPRFLQRLTWVDFRNGIDDNESFRRFVAGIRGVAPGRTENATNGRPSQERWTSRIPRGLLLAAPALVSIAVLIALMNWRVPTRARIDVSVKRAEFTLGGEGWTPILSPIKASFIKVQHFANIRFRPQRFEMADPSQYDLAADAYPGSAWKSVDVGPLVELQGQDETLQPAVGFKRIATLKNAIGAVATVTGKSGSVVTVEVPDSGSGMSLTIAGNQSTVVLTLTEEFELTTNHVKLAGMASLPFKVESSSFRARVLDPKVEVLGGPRQLTLAFALPPETKTLFTGDLKITGIKFTRQDATGAEETAVGRNGEITYPEFPALGKIAVANPDYLDLMPDDVLHVAEIAFSPEQGEFRFSMDGVVRTLGSGPFEFVRDHRLTILQHLWHGHRQALLIGIGLWVFPLTFGVYWIQQRH